MKRTSVPGEWTDGKDIYVGSPQKGFTKKESHLESWGDDPESIDTLTVSEEDIQPTGEQ